MEGFGFATLSLAAPKMLVAATDAGVRRFVLGVWGTYMPVGIALSLVLATLLLEPVGWRGLWFLNSGPHPALPARLRLGRGAVALACAGAGRRHL